MTEPRRVRLKPGTYAVVNDMDDGSGLYVAVRHDDTIYLLPKSMVEDVEPPLPPEPPEGLYHDRDGQPWHHKGVRWYRLNERTSWLWEADEVYLYGPFVPLVAINPDDPKLVGLIAHALPNEWDTYLVAQQVARALVDGARR